MNTLCEVKEYRVKLLELDHDSNSCLCGFLSEAISQWIPASLIHVIDPATEDKTSHIFEFELRADQYAKI